MWRVTNVGRGFSTPVVVGQRLYLLSSEGVENELVRAFNVADGAMVWSTRIGRTGKPDQEPSFPTARSTPTVDGDALYAFSSDGDLAALGDLLAEMWHASECLQVVDLVVPVPLHPDRLAERGVEVDYLPDLGKDKEKLLAVIGGYDGLAVRSATKATARGRICSGPRVSCRRSSICAPNAYGRS